MGRNELSCAIYIIKPEGMIHRRAIRRRLERAGLRIVSYRILLLDSSFVMEFYSDCDSPDLRRAIQTYMTCGETEIGMVDAEDVVALLGAVGGEHANPCECRQGTIRHLYGIKGGVTVGDCIYYRNAFHRSDSIAEAQRDLCLYDAIVSP